jgi:PhnB protein
MMLMAADTPNHTEYKPGTNFSVSLSGNDEKTLRGYFTKLSEARTVGQPLVKAPWGDFFGMCRDKFGISWLVNIAAPQ